MTGNPGHVGYMLQKDLLLPWRPPWRTSSSARASRPGDAARSADEAARDGAALRPRRLPRPLPARDERRHAPTRRAHAHARVRQTSCCSTSRSARSTARPGWRCSSGCCGSGRRPQSTVLFVTHDIDEAIFLADRVVVMSPRPGRVSEVIDVPLPRPRDVDVLTSETFTALKRRALDLIYGRAAGALDPEGTRRMSAVSELPVTARSRSWAAARHPAALDRRPRRRVGPRGPDLRHPAVRPARRPRTPSRRSSPTGTPIGRGLVATAQVFVLGFVDRRRPRVRARDPDVELAAPLYRILYPLMIVSQAIPVVAIGAALVIWLGFGLAPEARRRRADRVLPGARQRARRPAQRSTRTRSTSPGRWARRRWRTFRIVKLPATLTPLFSALKMSATFTVTGAILAESIASTTGGLGVYLSTMQWRFNTPACSPRSSCSPHRSAGVPAHLGVGGAGDAVAAPQRRAAASAVPRIRDPRLSPCPAARP